MRIVAITRVLNEADIIEAFIRHTAAYVTHHILLDNGSNDGTMNIIGSLREEGMPLTCLQTSAVSYTEEAHWTFMYDMAVRDLQADWVVCIDADEFIDDRALGVPFQEYLAAVVPWLSLIKAPMIGYNPTSKDNQQELVVPTRVTNRDSKHHAFKSIVRGHSDRNVTIEPGGHGVIMDQGMVCPWHEEHKLVWAHFGERSPWQHLSKVIIGWSKVLAAGSEFVAKGYSYHYGGSFEWLLNHPEWVLRDPKFFAFRHDGEDLVNDPIDYKGGELRYTAKVDHPMRMARVLISFLDQLARRHGELLDQLPAARAYTDEKNSKVETLFTQKISQSA